MTRKFETFDEAFALDGAGAGRASTQALMIAIREYMPVIDARLSRIRAQLSVILWTMVLGFAASLSVQVIILMRFL